MTSQARTDESRVGSTLVSVPIDDTKTSGNELLADALVVEGVHTAFFLMGGPMMTAANACVAAGLRMIDVRHEQGAAMMAQAFARVSGEPGVCMACSGPGVINLTTGLANALVDCVPVVALGGASAISHYGTGSFQEIDQIAIMRPVTKWAERVYDARRIPEYVARAFREAVSGKPGPVYLELPGDILYQQVDKASIRTPIWTESRALHRSAATAETIDQVVTMLSECERPVLLSGTGALWSKAAPELTELVDRTGMPFYTTPQGRGVIPEDHACFFGHARTTAMKEADLVLVVGTRLNYVFGNGRPPRFAENARFIRIDIDPAEMHKAHRTDVGIVGDAKTVVRQILEALAGGNHAEQYSSWRERLRTIEQERQPDSEAKFGTDQIPIHPLRLCRELRDFLDRDAVLVVDGQEILNYGRQVLPTFVPGHRLNSGPFGTMGVGMPFGVGAKAAKPDTQVVVLHGDGSFGMNCMEIDTAVRHKLPILVVISLNGGWTADPKQEKAGRDLGYTRYDRMVEALGCHGEFVQTPDEIRPALERAKKALAEGRPALVNVVTDWKARAQVKAFSSYMT